MVLIPLIIYKCSLVLIPPSLFLSVLPYLSDVPDPPPNASTRQSVASLGLLYCRSIPSYYRHTKPIVFGSIRDFVISIDPKPRDSLLPIWSSC